MPTVGGRHLAARDQDLALNPRRVPSGGDVVMRCQPAHRRGKRGEPVCSPVTPLQTGEVLPGELKGHSLLSLPSLELDRPSVFLFFLVNSMLGAGQLKRVSATS